MSENIIECINSELVLGIEKNNYELTVDNILVYDYAFALNKPSINSVDLLGNKTASDLGLVDITSFQEKEDKSNKITEISENSTDIQYASAKCIYLELQNKADVDLLNLSDDGQALFDSKANIGFSNINETAKELITNASMPSNTYTDITAGASGTTYTAPADGYFGYNSHTTGRFCSLLNSSTYLRVVSTDYYNAGIDFAGIMPVKKGDVVSLDYEGTWSPQPWHPHPFVFVYAQGEV